MLKQTQKSPNFYIAKTTPYCVSEPHVTESQLHERWGSLRFPVEFHTVDGTSILVIDGGMHNLNAGPDFMNALLLVDGDIKRGDVEIHINERGWKTHGHQDDPRYENVLLHVVTQQSDAMRHNDSAHFGGYTLLFNQYSGISHSTPAFVRQCTSKPITLEAENILQDLGWRRIQQKARQFSARLQRESLESVWYKGLLRGLGYGQNANQMEQIAALVPYQVALEIGLHSAETDVAAFILGLTGVAEHFNIAVPFWEYAAKKYQLNSCSFFQWKPLRSHPQNYPTLRLFLLFRELGNWRNLIDLSHRNGDGHYFLKKLEAHQKIPFQYREYFPMPQASLGKSRAVELLINLWIPLWLAQSDRKEMEEIQEWSRALPTLKAYKSVENFLRTSTWKDRVTPARLHPILLQGLLWLRHHYCSENLCELCPAMRETDF